MRGFLYAEVMHEWVPVLCLGLVLLLMCEVTVLQYVAVIMKISLSDSTLLC